MVEAAAQGKSQLPVELKFELDQRPTVGQPLSIDIAVVPQIDANGAAIQVSGGDGLSVPAGMSQIDLPGGGSGPGVSPKRQSDPYPGGGAAAGIDRIAQAR